MTYYQYTLYYHEEAETEEILSWLTPHQVDLLLEGMGIEVIEHVKTPIEVS